MARRTLCRILCVVAAGAAGAAVAGGGAVVVGRELSALPKNAKQMACAAATQAQAAELVAGNGGSYSWCDLKRDMRLAVRWRDRGTSYVAALYGPPRWSRGFGDDYATAVGLTQRVAFALISIAGNVRVVWFHWLTPAHPKFTLDPLNRLAVKAHVVAGSLNVAVPLVAAFAAPRVGRWAMWATSAIELVHCGTALRMMPNVFGCKVLMIPGYAACVLTKFGLAARLVGALLSPTAPHKAAVEWLWAYWCAHNTYAWVRIWYVVLCRLRVEENRYTIAILLAGCVCCGQAVGFWGILIILACLGAYHVALRVRAANLEAAVENGTIGRAEAYVASAVGAAAWAECARTPPVGPPGSATYARAQVLIAKYLVDVSTADARGYNDDAQGGLVFDLIDVDDDGALDEGELVAFLVSFGVTPADVGRLFAALPAAAGPMMIIDHAQFVSHFEPFWRFLFPLYVEELHRRFHKASTCGRAAYERLHADLAGDGASWSACPFAAAARADSGRALGVLRGAAAASSDAMDRAASTLGLATAPDLAKTLKGEGGANSAWAAHTPLCPARRSRPARVDPERGADP